MIFFELGISLKNILYLSVFSGRLLLFLADFRGWSLNRVVPIYLLDIPCFASFYWPYATKSLNFGPFLSNFTINHKLQNFKLTVECVKIISALQSILSSAQGLLLNFSSPCSVVKIWMLKISWLRIFFGPFSVRTAFSQLSQIVIKKKNFSLDGGSADPPFLRQCTVFQNGHFLAKNMKTIKTELKIQT